MGVGCVGALGFDGVEGDSIYGNAVGVQVDDDRQGLHIPQITQDPASACVHVVWLVGHPVMQLRRVVFNIDGRSMPTVQ